MVDLASLSRRFILMFEKSRLASDLATRYGMSLGAARFVAGETLSATMERIGELEAQGFKVTLDHLGENVENQKAAGEAAAAYLELLDALDREGLRSTLSLKLTQLGLSFDQQLAYQHLLSIVKRAAESRRFVRIDMESSDYTSVTLDLFRRCYKTEANVGVVLQSMLYRTEDDLRSLLELKANVRLVKGAYLESADVAYPDKQDVDNAYRRLAKIQLTEGGFLAIATHDERLIEDLQHFIDDQQIPDGDYEFQLLFGVRPGLQRRLLDQGYPVRLYVPYGKDWYPYFVRRLAERPANVGFVLRGLLRS